MRRVTAAIPICLSTVVLSTICLSTICLSTICLLTIPAFSQSKPGYQVGMITAVAPHAGSPESGTPSASYDVSVKVGDTVYVVLYTSPLGTKTVEYAAGRDILVLIGEKTVTFNDPLGNSSEIPILSRTNAATQSGAAQASPAEASLAPNAPTGNAPQAQTSRAEKSIAQTPIKSVELVGLAGVKDNTQGVLTIGDGKLRFAHAKKTAEISAAAMDDVITGAESQRVIRGTVGTVSMFGPYGSGRVLSLFRSGLDSLTIQYHDADGGLHGVVFGVPVGQAEEIKKELVAEGAHTNLPVQADPGTDSSKPAGTEGKQ
jgi:hypothetical protein